MRNQTLEVPFIAFYRKEYVQPELNINDLWKVYKYDAKVSGTMYYAQHNNEIRQALDFMRKPDAEGAVHRVSYNVTFCITSVAMQS